MLSGFHMIIYKIKIESGQNLSYPLLPFQQENGKNQLSFGGFAIPRTHNAASLSTAMLKAQLQALITFLWAPMITEK